MARTHRILGLVDSEVRRHCSDTIVVHRAREAGVENMHTEGVGGWVGYTLGLECVVVGNYVQIGPVDCHGLANRARAPDSHSGSHVEGVARV